MDLLNKGKHWYPTRWKSSMANLSFTDVLHVLLDFT